MGSGPVPLLISGRISVSEENKALIQHIVEEGFNKDNLETSFRMDET
jgi:hypothetical protein